MLNTNLQCLHASLNGSENIESFKNLKKLVCDIAVPFSLSSSFESSNIEEMTLDISKAGTVCMVNGVSASSLPTHGPAMASETSQSRSYWRKLERTGYSQPTQYLDQTITSTYSYNSCSRFSYST